MAGRVNNINYILAPGDEGTVIEDQTLPAESIVEAIKSDFNNTAVNKAVFVTEEVTDEPVIVDESAEPVEE